MKFLFHFMLLIIYIGTSNTSVFDDLRENVLQLLKNSIPDLPKPQIEPKSAIAQPEHSFSKYSFRDGEKEYFERDIAPYKNDPVTVFVDDDIEKPTPKLKLMKRRRKKVRYNNGGTPAKEYKFENILRTSNMSYRNEDENKLEREMEDIELAKQKAQILRNVKQYENKLNSIDTSYFRAGMRGKPRYHMDPVLNILQSEFSRRYDKVVETSSSHETSLASEYDWKEEWKLYWTKKKLEALNSSFAPIGDTVNMLGARPWGVHCGDPNQHDMSWGTCTLNAECEAEYRVYRGDFFCGRTDFVCCGILEANYDLVQGVDFSFEDKDLSTNEEEKKRGDSDEATKKKRKAKQLKKRKRKRIKRKNQIIKTIKRIIKEIKKVLDRHYRNGTAQRRKKTRLLKKFIKHLKNQYRNDRNSVKEIHEQSLMKIDDKLIQKLNEIKTVNDEFMKNDTFREIIINGTITKEGARMLLQAYPQLVSFIKKTRRNGILRRAKTSNEDYDVEYGYLYE